VLSLLSDHRQAKNTSHIILFASLSIIVTAVFFALPYLTKSKKSWLRGKNCFLRGIVPCAFEPTKKGVKQ
jgi:hypothetical protein